MSQGLILIDTLSLACWEKKEEREKKTEVGRVFFSQGWSLDPPCWLCWTSLLQLLGAIKG
jgi:hypothetical protein